MIPFPFQMGGLGLASSGPRDPFFPSVTLLLPLTANFNALAGPNFTASGATISGGAALFDGINDFLSAAANAAFGIGAGPYTVEGYGRRATASSGNRCLFDNRSSGGDEGIAIYATNVTGALGFAVYNNSGKIIDAATTISDSVRQHWAVARDVDDELYAYVHGTSVGNTTDARALEAVPGCVIGDNYLTASHPFEGELNWIRLTLGCRYPGGTSFPPPSTPFPNA